MAGNPAQHRVAETLLMRTQTHMPGTLASAAGDSTAALTAVPTLTEPGVVIPETPDILATVVQAHMIAAPDVPLIGWDIAVTPGELGVYCLDYKRV